MTSGAPSPLVPPVESAAGFWDRPWALATVLTVLRPVSGISVEHVNERYAGLLAELPSTAWLARYPGPVATAGLDDSMVEDAVDDCARLWEGHPVRVVIGAETVVVLHSHSVGDGTSTNALVNDLLAPAGTPFLTPTRRRPSQWAVLGRALAYWARSPSRVRGALRRQHRRSPAQFDERLSTTSVLVHRTLDAATVHALRRRRDRENGTASVSMLLLRAVLDALAEHDVDVVDAVVPVNLRRYLRDPGGVSGNLVSMVRVPAGLTTEEQSAFLSEAVETGRPLARFLLANLRYRLRPRRLERAAPELTPSVGWCDLGELEGWGDLGWSAPSREVMGPLMSAWGRRVNFYLGRLDGEIHMTCTVNPDAFDAAVVTRAIDDVCEVLRREGDGHARSSTTG